MKNKQKYYKKLRVYCGRSYKELLTEKVEKDPNYRIYKKILPFIRDVHLYYL
jgi:hypothetical protein